MKTLTAIMQALLAAALIWLSAWLGMVGVLATVVSLSMLMLVFATAAMIGGIALTLHMLRRDSDWWLRALLVIAIPVGVYFVYISISAYNFIGF